MRWYDLDGIGVIGLSIRNLNGIKKDGVPET